MVAMASRFEAHAAMLATIVGIDATPDLSGRVLTSAMPKTIQLRAPIASELEIYLDRQLDIGQML